MAYNILLVDDSKAMRTVIAKVLRMTGLNLGIREAGSGREALDTLETDWIDMVITDIHMPAMDGLELITRIRQNPTLVDTPILVISTEGRHDFMDRTKDMGVAGYLKKPFQPTDLRNVILNVLESNHENVEPATDFDDESSDF